MGNKINTKYIGHHISSGGFIFYLDEKEQQVYTLLIRNKKNELWICKGHIENGENQVDAALREFNEETGLDSKYLKYIGLCKKISYSFEEFGGKNTKDVYIHVFKCSEKINLSKNIGVENIVEIDWYKYEDAIDKISYNKEELVKAYRMFLERRLKFNNCFL